MAKDLEFTHLNTDGKANMVDVSGKNKVKRIAKAEAKIILAKETINLIESKALAKGEVFALARAAGIMAAKKTSELIPLCHNIDIDQISIDFKILPEAIVINSVAICVDRTGIEMEALMAVSVAALTIYDMCKAVDKKMKIEAIFLVEKTKEVV